MFFFSQCLSPSRGIFVLQCLFLVSAHVCCFQDLQGQVTAGEEELGQVKTKAEETEGNLRQTVEQLNEVSLFC